MNWKPLKVAALVLLAGILVYVLIGGIGYSLLDRSYHRLKPGMSRAAVRSMVRGCTERTLANGNDLNRHVDGPQGSRVCAYDWLGPIYFDMSIVVAYDEHDRVVSKGETFD